MRFKILLISLFCAMGILRAQDTIPHLIISEARIDNMHGAYVELTNMGDSALDLSLFEFGKVGPWTQPYTPGNGEWFMLPKKILAPGKTFVMAKVNDWVTRMWLKNPDLYNRYESKPEFSTLADMRIHIGESPVAVPQSVDSISPMAPAFTLWNGSYCWYVRYHFKNGLGARDSVVIDQVGGIFDEGNGTSQDIMHDVAGYKNATGNAVLIRKAVIKNGNLDFNTGRGTNITDGEWISVPFLLGGWEPLRAVFWTTGNHGDYKLSSLTSSIMTLNLTDNTLTVPWGVRNNDSIMYKFNRVPGIAWHYDYSPNHTDSAYVSVRTGDKLTVYACGNTVEKAELSIIALPPTASDNKVIPKYVPNILGWYREAGVFCQVSENNPVIDTISDFGYNMRVDTLLKYLEKPDIASWEFVWVDGITRADLKMGDKLKVTSQNGAVKEYYIKPNRYFPSHNAYLSAITWPDIPEFYKGILGWTGDTIPTFNSAKLDYKVEVPFDAVGIPAMIGKTQQLNARLHVNKAISLSGGTAERSITFTSTAEDDTTIKVYNVELMKEKDPSNIQPWEGEPFISQYVFKQDFNNYLYEVVNPRLSTMDLSDYMIVWGYYGSAAEAITNNSATTDFATRYRKYIPGYKWVNSGTWASTPGRVELDAVTKHVLQPGDVFTFAYFEPGSTNYPANLKSQIDLDFSNNPWGDNLSNPGDATCKQWWGQKIMLFKILNDTIKMGLKPANDPNDFKLIDVIGDVAGSRPSFGGIPIDQTYAYTRKPNIYKGNPVIEGSNGGTEDSSEWIMMNESRYQAKGYGWPAWRQMVADGIGSHFMNEVTVYKSTVSSVVYKVSEGFTESETIKGLGANVTVDNFYSNIIKADTGQHLKVRKVADGSILASTDIISLGDSLIVVSADSANTSKYIIDTELLSDDAILTSTAYTINVSGNTGTVGGFPYNTLLKDVVAGVTLPLGANMAIVDENGAYKPLIMLNFDTTYVDVKVSDKIMFEVTAENGVTKIVYTLKPTASNTDAFVTSDVYSVNEATKVIELVPNGTTVSSFLSNVVPVTGATIKLVDKFSMERTLGIISKDDKLVVTAADGVTKNTYYLSMLSIDIQKYFAYVLSDVYIVDQEGLTINGSINVSMKVSDLLGNLTTADFATVKCIDKNGVVKASTDNLASGDKVQVTSGDGSKTVEYVISTLTNAQTSKVVSYTIYPNPSVGDIFVNGISEGNEVYVYNALGAIVTVKVATQTEVQISLKNQPKGVYLIKVVSKGNKVVTGKIILK